MDINRITSLITEKLIAWFEALIKILPNIILAAIVLAIGLYIGNYIRKFSHKLFSKISTNITLNSLFSSIAYYIFIGIVIFTVLSILNLDKAVTSILAGAGILGLALAFAFQDIATNFMSGIFISIRKPLKVGDIVQIKDYMGEVKVINLRDTVVETFQGKMVIIPNKEVFQNPIENYTILQKRRFDLSIGVSYGDDLEKVRQVTLDAVRGIEGLSKEDEITVVFVGFGDSSVDLSVRMWVNSVGQLAYLSVGSSAIINIKKAYHANDIVIPFPIRTLDFGIKGGTTISEMPLHIDYAKEKLD